MRVDIDKLTLATHFKIAHPLEKKAHRKLIHKWKKMIPTVYMILRCRPEQRRNFWAKVPKASSPSRPTASAQKPRGRAKRKKEHVRKGATLPDVIRINNHIRFTRMSIKEYDTKCLDLSRQCGKKVACDEHTSLLNLRQITRKLKKLVSQSPGDSADWKKCKKIQSRCFGYLSSAINNREIKKLSLIHI